MEYLKKCFSLRDNSIPLNTEITKIDVLSKQDHTIVHGILLAYTSSTDLYSELNRALRDKETAYADSMGPYAYILY